MDVFSAPPPFLRLQNWLGPERVQWLLDYVDEHRSRFRQSGVNTPEGTRVDPRRRISQKIADVPEIAAEIEPRVNDLLPGLFSRLGTPVFTPSRYETELVAHGEGAFLGRHRDAKPGQEHGRAVSGVYYFFREPKAFSGGALRLYSMNDKTFVDIEPENDCMLFFPPWFPHEVLPVSCPSRELLDSRFAINCWLRR